MKRKLAWLMICVMMIASIPFTAAAEPVETASDNFAVEAISEIAEVAEITEAVQEEEPAFAEEDESPVFFTGEGEPDRTRVQFVYGSEKRSFYVTDMNNNGVSIHRILDNFQIRTQESTEVVATASVAGSSYTFNKENTGDKIGEWKVRCDAEPSDGQLIVVFGEQNYSFQMSKDNTPPYRLSVNGSEGSVTKPVNERFSANLFEISDKVTKIVWSLPDRNTASFVNNDGGLSDQTSITYEKGESRIRNNIDLKGLKEGTVTLQADITDNLGTISADIAITFTQNSGDNTWRVGFFDGDTQYTSISLRNGETRKLRIEKNNSVVTNEVKSYSVRVTDPQGSDAAPVFIVGESEAASIEKADWKSNDNWITIKSKSDGFAHIEVTLYGTNTEGDEGRAGLEINRNGGGDSGYDGPRGIYDSERPIQYWLEGWEDTWNDENGGEPVIINRKDGVNQILINVKDELWNRVFNNVSQSKGINLRLYFKKPADSVVAFSHDFRGDDDTNGMMETLLSLPPQHNCSEEQIEKKSAVDVSLFTIIPGDNNSVILAPRAYLTDHYLGYAWFTSTSPKQAYNFGTGEQVQNFEVGRFRISFADHHNITVRNEVALEKSWITFDADGTYGNAGAILKTEYRSGNMSYTLDAELVRNNGGAAVSQKDLITKITIPGAENLVASKISGLGPSTVNGVGNVLTLAMDAYNFDQTKQSEYELTYTANGENYRKRFTLSINMRFNSVQYDEVGFRPVDGNRMILPNDLTDGSRGFYFDRLGHGEIATKWSGAGINMQDVRHNMDITVPTDKEGLIGYKFWTAEGNIGLYDGNTEEAKDIKNHRLPSGEFHSYKGEETITFPVFYMPDEFTVDGKRIFAIHTRAPGEDEISICFIEWIYDQENENNNIFEYYFWNTESGHTDLTMPESVHQKTNLPEPRLYAIYDSKGVERKDTGYSLKVEYFGKDASYANGDYDYYRITLVDPFGEPADLQQGWVELIFSYPNGKTKTEMENMNFVLAHYQDEMHESSAKEKLSFEEDGIHVTLDHFSPFLMTWTETEAPALTGLEIAEAPKKTVYTAGESFDQTGMEILAVYSDGQRKTVTGYTVKPSGKLTVGDTYVEISYTENGVTKTITQKITVRAASSPTPVYADTDRSDTSESPLYTGTWNAPVKNGTWSQDAHGVWHYTSSEIFRNTWGYIVNPYAKEGQHTADWFWFDRQGNMLTGWQFINGKWYYLNPTKDGTLGACQLGGVTPDGWTVDANGAWIESIPQKKV